MQLWASGSPDVKGQLEATKCKVEPDTIKNEDGNFSGNFPWKPGPYIWKLKWKGRNWREFPCRNPHHCGRLLTYLFTLHQKKKTLSLSLQRGMALPSFPTKILRVWHLWSAQAQGKGSNAPFFKKLTFCRGEGWRFPLWKPQRKHWPKCRCWLHNWCWLQWKKRETQRTRECRYAHAHITWGISEVVPILPFSQSGAWSRFNCSDLWVHFSCELFP